MMHSIRTLPSVKKIHLPSDAPIIVGYKITPHVEVLLPDGSITTDDIPESSPSRGFYLQHTWYRIGTRHRVPSDEATLQCFNCLKGKAIKNKKRCKDGEIWFMVGQSRTYTPAEDDIGHVLALECTAVDCGTRQDLIPLTTLKTAEVVPAPSPTPRRMIPLNLETGLSGLHVGRKSTTWGTFTLLSYNILADLYKGNVYSYCPAWALSWEYRRQSLLREILGYKADILCLQEVQSDHFNDFFKPELAKHGYGAVYKHKTFGIYTSSGRIFDGCATFYHRDHFSLVEEYKVDLSSGAQTFVLENNLQNEAKARLIKDNVAAIAVLASCDSTQGVGLGKKRLLCVANTHITANKDLKDVKLFQVYTLVKELEKKAKTFAFMLMCGDFNSTPGSAVHALLTSGRVEASHQDLKIDPYSILQPISKIRHNFCLASAYSAFCSSEVQRHLMDTTTREPLCTHYSQSFPGTLDYIFYSANSLTVDSLLELLDKEVLRKDTALPSPVWPSDHIALMVHFRCRT